MQRIKASVENKERLERKNNTVVMRLENISKNAKEKAIELS